MIRGWRLIVAVITVVAATWWLRTAVVDSVSVASGSMAPTVCTGDRLLVLRAGAGDEAGRGDLVTFHDPVEDQATLKRVVAVTGDVVEVRDGVLFINDERVEEGYVDYRTVDGSWFGPVEVHADALFVLGDERELSVDSRDYGSIARSAVDGRVVARLWSDCPAEEPSRSPSSPQSSSASTSPGTQVSPRSSDAVNQPASVASSEARTAAGSTPWRAVHR